MPSGHPLSLSALIVVLLTLQNYLQICESKTREPLDDNLDLTYSDTNHGPQTAAAHQQVVYIDHGGGAISQIRRTSFFPNPSVPSPPFRPHVEHYPNSVFENNIAEDPYLNFPQDIPRLFERRNGPHDNDQRGLQLAPPPVPFIPHNSPQPITPEIHQQIPPIPQPLPPFPHHELHRITHPQSQPISQPLPQPYQHQFPQSIPQPISHAFPQHFGHHISQPLPQQLHSPIHQPISQPIPQSIPQPIPQPIPPPETHSLSQPYRHPIDDIEDERFLIHNEIERIPKPSNQMKPAKREPPPTEPPPPPPPPPTPVQEQPVINHNPFFDFNSPELFGGGIDGGLGGFDPFGPQIFQRRRLTTNNAAQDVNQNSIGYPPYAYYKGEDSPPTTKWPKIFKFSDGRSNLYDFEKQKKQNKIKFASKETYFDHISRDAFLILHGGTYAQ